MLDGAVAVFDGKEGVEAQSETVWRQATKYNVPRICFINKMDKLGADFEFSFNSIRERLGAPAVAVQIPIGQSNTFEGMIDLVEGIEIRYDLKNDKDQGKTQKVTPVGDNYREQYEKWRGELIEKVAETDDAMMEQYLEGQEPTKEQLKAALRKGDDQFPVAPRVLRPAR